MTKKVRKSRLDRIVEQVGDFSTIGTTRRGFLAVFAPYLEYFLRI